MQSAILVHAMQLLHYRQSGTAGPVVVLLHGYLSSASYWKPVESILQRTHRVIALDLLGFGNSPKPKNGRYDCAQQTEYIMETLTKIIGDQSFILVGHSMGALIACYAAAYHPRRISRIIMINPPVFASAAQARADIVKSGRMYKTLLYKPLGRVLWTPATRALKLWRGRRHPLLAESFLPVPHYARQRSLLNIIEAQPFAKLIARCPAPVTVLAGKYDRKIYSQNLQRLTLPAHVDVRWFDRGHHIPHQQPQAVVNTICDSVAI